MSDTVDLDEAEDFSCAQVGLPIFERAEAIDYHSIHMTNHLTDWSWTYPFIPKQVFPEAHVIGVDLSPYFISVANFRAREAAAPVVSSKSTYLGTICA